MTHHPMPYDQDVYLWSQEQAALLREGAWQDVDIAHVIEEIDSVGINLRHALGSRLYRLLIHLLKWRYQPSRRSRSWEQTIMHQRDAIDRLCSKSPSLVGTIAAEVREEYPRARRRASQETGLPLGTFPATCPWETAQLLDPDCWPEEEPRP